MPANIFDWFLVPYLTQEQKMELVASGDPVRYGTVFLSLQRIHDDNIPGSMAESTREC